MPLAHLAIDLIDDLIGPADPATEKTYEENRRFDSLGALPPQAGQTIQTKGCGKCGGSMYRTVETDSNGNPTGSNLYVCTACGHMSA